MKHLIGTTQAENEVLIMMSNMRVILQMVMISYHKKINIVFTEFYIFLQLYLYIHLECKIYLTC